MFLKKKKRGRLGAIQPISYIRGILFFFFFFLLHIFQAANTSEDVIVGERIVFQFSTVFLSTNLIISLTHRGFYLQLVTSLPNLLRLSRMVPFLKATVDCPYFQFLQLEPQRFGLTALGFNINSIVGGCLENHISAFHQSFGNQANSMFFSCLWRDGSFLISRRCSHSEAATTLRGKFIMLKGRAR